MTLTARRVAAALSAGAVGLAVLLLALVTLSSMAPTADAAVMGIDFGSEFIKVSAATAEASAPGPAGAHH